MDLVPYQQKRQKVVHEATSQEAIFSELRQYFTKVFTDYPIEKVFTPLSGDSEHPLRTSLLGSFSAPQHVSLSELSQLLAPFLHTSLPEFATLNQLEDTVLMLFSLKKLLQIKRPLDVLPPPYRAFLTKIYTNKTTVDALATQLSSKKRAKKYMRIFQKRLGIYSQKKPPFKKTALS